MASDPRGVTGSFFFSIIGALASAAAIASPILLLVAPFNTYTESGKIGTLSDGYVQDLLVVFSLATVGYLSPKVVLRFLAALVAVASLLEIGRLFLHHLYR